MVASGAPEKDAAHTKKLVDVALSMIKNIKKLKITSEMKVNIRIGTLIYT